MAAQVRLGLFTAAAIGYAAYTIPDRVAMERLSSRFGYSGNPAAFPIAFFRERVHSGMTTRQVASSLPMPKEIRYYLVKQAGSPDSVLVQQFAYSLAWDELHANISYRQCVVTDVEAADYGIGQARRITPEEAQRLLARPNEDANRAAASPSQN